MNIRSVGLGVVLVGSCFLGCTSGLDSREQATEDGGTGDGGTANGTSDSDVEGGSVGDAGTTIDPCLDNPCYYVDSLNGDDSKNGSTEATAWKTLAKVSGMTFQPGDYVVLKRDRTWRETLTLKSSGTDAKPITFGAYGTGSPPKILGSAQSMNWSNVGGNIWMSGTAVLDPAGGAPHDGQTMGSNGWPGGLYFVELDGTVTWGHQEKYLPLSNLTKEYDWVWDSGHVYVLAATDPGARYGAVEACQRQSGLLLDDKEHIVIQDLEFQFQCATGIEESYPTANLSGLTVRNCRASYMGIKNGAAQGFSVTHSNMLIQNNVVHDIGRRSVSINAYGSAFTIHDVIVENNTLYNGYHTTGVDVSTSTATGFDKITIRNNLIYEDVSKNQIAPEDYVSESIFLQNYGVGGATFTNVLVHNNVIRNTTKDAIQLENIQSSFLFNNTFYGVNPNRTNNTIFVTYSNGSTNAVLKNNVFYGTGSFAKNTTAVAVYLGNNVQPANVTADYNLYFQTDALEPIVVTSSGSYRMADWQSLKAATGWEQHSPVPQDPLLLSATDQHLEAGSPAINAGVDVGLPFMGSAPDLGAFETTTP